MTCFDNKNFELFINPSLYFSHNKSPSVDNHLQIFGSAQSESKVRKIENVVANILTRTQVNHQP